LNQFKALASGIEPVTLNDGEMGRDWYNYAERDRKEFQGGQEVENVSLLIGDSAGNLMIRNFLPQKAKSNSLAWSIFQGASNRAILHGQIRD
jgi:hypothetical protein